MSSENQFSSPWARPADGSAAATMPDSNASGAVEPGQISGPRAGTEPIVTADRGPAPGGANMFGAGQVTGEMTVQAAGEVPETLPRHRVHGWNPGTPGDPTASRRRTMRWFTGAAGGILVTGVVVVLALVLTGRTPFPVHTKAAPDTRPILAKLCPPPSGAAAPPSAAPAVPAGPRTVDNDSGISYRAYGQPWRDWDMNWETGGELGVTFRTGQFFVTEEWPDHGDYMATILSGSVPAATNDALTLDLKCAGAQVTADVRQAYYPVPNTMDTMVDKATTIGGRPAWLSEFRLHFHADGLTATSELVAIALIDVGKPNASIMYVSIPDTHKQYDYVIDEVLASVRPT